MNARAFYPSRATGRDQWILSHRPERKALDPLIPYNFFVEQECAASGAPESVATIFLTNRECPFRCLMCDLWRNTLPVSVPLGAIPRQIDHALRRLEPARHVKLYNAGSFFDPQAIPPADHPAVAERVSQFATVIVENHPALVGESCVQFRDRLNGRLEVAMGLETAHPEVLAGLNKRMTLEQFSSAASFLRSNEIDLRVFILVQPPLMQTAEALHWACRSLEFAINEGATAITLIPTRGGNGALEALSGYQQFSPPALHTLECALEYGLQQRAARVFADTWDVSSSCAMCLKPRLQRLQQMNLSQIVCNRIPCEQCRGLS